MRQHSTQTRSLVLLSPAGLDGVSVGEYEPGSKGAEAYRALAKEMLSRG